MAIHDWSTAMVGDEVLIKSVRWTVEKIDGDSITVRSEKGQVHTGTPGGTADFTVHQRDTALAEGVLEVALGAVTDGRQDGQGRWTTPVEYDHPGALSAHLHIFHGLTTSTDSLREMTEQHKAAHGPAAKDGTYTAHVHTPDFVKRRVS